MKKFILPSLFVFLLLLFSSSTYASKGDECQEQYNSYLRKCSDACPNDYDLNGNSKCNQRCLCESAKIQDKCMGWPVDGCPSEPTPSLAPSNDSGQIVLGKEISCEEAKQILKSADCPFWAKKLLNVWCYQEEFKGTTAEEAMAYTETIMSQPASYTLDSDSCFEGTEEGQEESGGQPQQSLDKDKKQYEFTPYIGDKIPVFIGEWFQALSTGIMGQEFIYFSKNFSKEVLLGRDEREIAEEEGIRKLKELSERKANLTDEVVDQYKNTPYQIDILHGQAQIKLPGQDNWQDLKQGDKIPAGSTVFTGMDTTTVLTIENKGVVQIAPFSEVIINESGLEQATLNKELFNDIEIDKGEIEVNIESGVYTAPILQVSTPQGTVGVRGTHFWVSYNKDKKATTIGVYEGEVEVKDNKGQTISLVPNEEKPGIAIITQKLSLVKLAVAGVIALGIIGGVVLYFKKRRPVKPFRKK